MTLAHEDRATVRAVHPSGPMRLRGSGAGLDWQRDTAPHTQQDDASVFELEIAHGETVEIKLVRADGTWMTGRNVIVGCGDRVVLHPAFERACGRLEPARELHGMRYRVMLPPSYDEQPSLRYPVLYVLDGQSVWSDGTDPFGVWGLDRALDTLWDLGALAEIVVVSIDTSEARLDRLGPFVDAAHGGGGGAAHLAAIVDALKPQVDRGYRTRADRGSTAMMGSSMGGLFSFWSAWTRPDVFGAAICLSPSFWWADRRVIREVAGGACPHPRPRLYLDSGAAASAFEPDGSTRDGVHNARAMYRALIGHCYAAGDDLHLLSWAGHRHDAASWAARVSVPLQIVFPPSA